MGVQIGKIIKSENHTVYWVQVDNDMENKPSPSSEDCAFGTFVKILPHQSQQNGGSELVGLIIDTILVDRDFLRAGPRLTQDFDAMKIAFPDFIDERLKLVMVLLIGYIDANKNPQHLFPNQTPHLNDPVEKMDDSETKQFHCVNGSYKIGYFSTAMGTQSNLIKPLLLRILTRLEEFFPDEQKPILKLLRNNLEFKMKMEGGFL